MELEEETGTRRWRETRSETFKEETNRGILETFSYSQAQVSLGGTDGREPAWFQTTKLLKLDPNGKSDLLKA